MMIHANRLVALLDVLGVADQLTSAAGLEMISSAYGEIIAEARELTERPKALRGSPEEPRPNFLYSHFVFDTIVLVSHELDTKGVKDFLFGISLMMERFFERGLPLRGTIGCGTVSIIEDQGLVLSDQLKTLSKIEAAQNWSGCAIIPNAEQIIVENLLGGNIEAFLSKAPLSGCPIVPYEIPMKVDAKVEFYPRICVNWAYAMENEKVSKGLSSMKPVRDKHDNTAAFVEYIRSLQDEIVFLSEENRPAHTMRFMKARAGCRILFRDNNGFAVNPSGTLEITFLDETEKN
ncbi:hypothetical protein L6172_03375 [Thalassospiraceae bacterium SW-3-3]|nr:hypothetical protein L6172_03375 [Thalassospiraceae bacterium SW-3-3]